MKDKKRRFRLISALCLGVLVVVLGLTVAWQHAVAARLSTDIAGQKALLGKQIAEAKQRIQWRKDYGEYSLKLGGLWSKCSWSDQMPFMVAQLTAIVESRGLRIESMQPQPMIANKQIPRFPMRIGLQADLPALAGILEEIEKTWPLLCVDRLDVRNAAGSSGKLQVDMTISSFVALDPRAPLAKRRTLPNVEKRAAVRPADNAETPAASSPGKPVRPADVSAPSKMGNVPNHRILTSGRSGVGAVPTPVPGSAARVETPGGRR